MTPLAHRIVKELTLPIKRRTFNDNAGILPRMSDVHCFECTDVFEAAHDLSIDLQRNPYRMETLAFLPAPRTWLEWNEAGVGRMGVLITEKNGPDGAPLFALTDFAIDEKEFASVKGGFLELTGSLSRSVHLPAVCPFLERVTDAESDQTGISKYLTYMIYAFLAMINSPKIVNRRQHMPHAGLQRALFSQMKFIGKFPLRAYTVIRLDISPPKDMAESAIVEARLTGQRALHFCRSHLRVRNGKLEIVRAHWRGDASLGIKRSRYKLVAPAHGIVAT